MNQVDGSWAEDWLRDALGYVDRRSFRAVLQRAMKACLLGGIDPSSDFKRVPDGSYLLSRFACFLIAMNSDSKKPQVASVQVHLAGIANEVASHFEQSVAIARVIIRDEVSDGMKALASTAKDKGVNDFGKFMNAGYRGMYNMDIESLKKHKGVPVGEDLLDRMDPPELAANLFRLTQTDEKMKNESETGQEAAEKTAHKVGQVVRKTMIKLSGNKPENLSIADGNIRAAKKGLKTSDRNLKVYSKKPKVKRLFDTLPVEPRDSAANAGYTPEPEEDEGYDMDEN